MNKISEETKASVINRYASGESVAIISEETGIARSTIYGWTKQISLNSSKKPVNKATINDLKRTVTRLTAVIDILQRIFEVDNIPTQIRLEELEKLYGEFNIHNLCEALKVPRGTFYNHIKRNKRNLAWYAQRREELRTQILEVYHGSNQIYGSKKIAAILKTRGIRVSDKMVRELMADMGLISIRESAKEYYDKEKRSSKNYLNQQFHTARPNEVWVSDITYFKFKEKNYYICVIVD